MNCKLFTLAILMCCLGWSANAGNACTPAASPTASENDDTVNMYRITFTQPIRKVVLEDYCDLIILPDTLNYLTTSRPSKRGISDKTFSYKLSSVGELKIESQASGRKLELHLDMGTSVVIETNDFSNAEVHINKQLNMLNIKTNDYSNVLVTTDLDTIRATSIQITTNDFSNAKFNSPVNAYTVSLTTNDFSNAKLPSGRVNKIFESQSENATINYGHLPNVDIYMGDESEFNDSDEKVYKKSKKSEERTSFWHDGDWVFRFAWAFNNWGKEPYSGLVPMKGPYGLGTTFSSYQLELAFFPLCSRHLDLGFGLGYESNVYRFSNPYVTLDNTLSSDALATFQIQERQDAYWSSRLVARYVTMPLTLRWKPAAYGDFSISLTALPGLNYTSRNTGLKHKGEYTDHDGKTTNREDLSSVMNPFKLDGRLSLSYNHISVFVQMAALPLNLNMDKKVYPIKLGFILNLFDD